MPEERVTAEQRWLVVALGKGCCYQEAKEVPKDQKKKRSDLFSQARKVWRYAEYDLHAYASIVSKQSKWIAQKIDVNTQQTRVNVNTVRISFRLC